MWNQSGVYLKLKQVHDKFKSESLELYMYISYAPKSRQHERCKKAIRVNIVLIKYA